ncbi:DMT family transporter [Qipengyuania citrea]|uniref:DMT family transporter n=1 Tax=Qipengyuania citrea TaxID=225971 RepID=UPI00329A06E2
MSFRALLIMAFCNIAWALNVVVSKLAITDFSAPPLFYALVRSVIVAAVLIPLLRPLPAKLWQVLVIGLAISGGSFALLFMGLETASPSAAGVVSLSGAPMTVLFAILFLGEKVRWRRGLGIGLAFGGVLFAMAGENQMQTSTGLLLVFLSAMVGALGTVFVKRLDLSSIRLQGWAAVASVAVLLPCHLRWKVVSSRLWPLRPGNWRRVWSLPAWSSRSGRTPPISACLANMTPIWSYRSRCSRRS